MSLIRTLPLALVFAALVTSVVDARADDKQACVAASTNGQQHRLDGKLLAARASFTACTQSSCPSVVRSACAEWLTALDKSIPSIVVVARDPLGKDVPVTRVTVNGAPVDVGRVIDLDPGEHVVAVETKTGAKGAETVKVAESEKNRLVVIAIVPLTPVMKPIPPPSRPNATVTRGPWPWIFGGIGVIGIASAAGFGAAAYYQVRDLRATCAGSCSHDDVRSVRTKLVVSDLSLGVGVVAAAISTYLFLRTPGSVRVESGPGIAGLSLVTSF